MRYYSSIEPKKLNQYKNIIAEHFTRERLATKIMMCFTSGVPVKPRATVIVRGGGVASLVHAVRGILSTTDVQGLPTV